MYEFTHRSKPTVIELPAPEGVYIEQGSTRGDGSVELAEPFSREDIDFSRAIDHIGIHTEGSVAGSQFNGTLFKSPESVADMLRMVLPEGMQYDQHNRAEITIAVEGQTLGYAGVKPLGELEGQEGITIERAARMPGGEPATEEGIKGVWYPEMARNTETGKYEVAVDAEGNVKNPHGKFEPEALIAVIEPGSISQAMATNKATIIIQKNPENSLPTVLTVFPGENAPAFPARIQSETFQMDTLQGGPEAAYWNEHAFIKAAH